MTKIIQQGLFDEPQTLDKASRLGQEPRSVPGVAQEPPPAQETPPDFSALTAFVGAWGR